MSDIHPPNGTRLRVFWVGEKRWFRGVVKKSTREDGSCIHHIQYEDGDSKWHNLAQEIWLELPGGKASATPKPPPAATSGAKRPAASSSSDAADSSPSAKKKVGGSSGAAVRGASPPAKGTKAPKAAAAPKPKPPTGPKPKPPKGPLPPSAFGKPPTELPPLIAVDPTKVDVFPCGVIRVRDAVPHAERQRLWDAVVCGGFDYREVVSSQGQNRNGANMWYTQAAGAPDILLHFNYYEPPVAEQPPPMSLLCAADAVFKAATRLDIAQHALEPRTGDDGEADDEASSTHGAGSSDEAGGGHAEADGASGASGSGRTGAGGASGEGGGEAEGGAGGRAGGEGGGEALKPRKEKKEKEQWVDEAAADAATLAENVAKKAAEEMRALLWPRKPNFRSVLAIGYRPTDSFRWHTDLAGEDGWVCSISVGATAVFEYLPTPSPSALRRARARAEGEEVVRVEVGSGDALLFHGGLLAHRLSAVEPQPDAAQLAGCHMEPYVRLNLQVRVFGSGLDYGLHELLERGFDYVN